VRDERVNVGHLLDDLGCGLSAAVSRLGFNTDHEGVGIGGEDVLKGGDELVRMQRHHPIVVVSCRQQHRRILLLSSHAV